MDEPSADVMNRNSMDLGSCSISTPKVSEMIGSCVSRLRDRGEMLFRLLAAGVLLFAAGLKYLYIATTPLLPADSGWEHWIWIIQIEFEVIWGLWLLLGSYPRFTRLASALLFTTFAAFSGYGVMMGHESCGCFGVVRVKPLVAFALDIFFALAFLCIRVGEESERGRAGLPLGRLVVVLVVWALFSVPIALFSSGPRIANVLEDDAITGDRHAILLDPQQWIGKRFPLVKHIDVGPTFVRGHWHLLFVRPGCPYCEEALQQLFEDSHLQATDKEARWAIVELPPLDENASTAELPVHAKVLVGRLDKGRIWIAKIPFVVILADGIVVEWAPRVQRRT